MHSFEVDTTYLVLYYIETNVKILTWKRMDIINTCTLPGVAYGNLAKKQQQEKFLFKNSTKQGKTNKQFAYKS